MSKSYEEQLLGRWNVIAINTVGSNYGNILDGQVVFNRLTGNLSGKLFITEKPAQYVSVMVNGPKVNLSINGESISAEGWFRGPNVISGTFTRPGNRSGNLILARSEESNTNIRGNYTFEGVFNSAANQAKQLDGILTLEQGLNQRAGFIGVSHRLQGKLKLNQLNKELDVTGAAIGGEVYLVIDTNDVDTRIVAMETRVTKNVLEGTLKGATPKISGNWKATLRPDRPSTNKNWEFKAKVDEGAKKGSTLEGNLLLSQDANGGLTGSFNPEKNGKSQSVSGEVSPLGQITFTIGSTRFTGQFMPVYEKGANGVFVDTSNRASGKWGIR